MYKLFIIALMLGCSETALAACENKMIVADQALSFSGASGTPVASSKSGAQITATETGSVAKLTLANEIVSKPKIVNKPGGVCSRSGKFTSNSWELSLSAPLNKNGGPTEIATLDRLSSGISASFKFSYGFTSGLLEKNKNSENVTVTDVPQTLRTQQKKAFELAKENCRRQTPADEIQECKKHDLRVADTPGGEGYPEEFIAQWALEEYIEHFMENAGRTFWISGGATIGNDDFKYIDPSDLSSKTTNEFEYKAEISATYSAFKSNTSVTLGAELQSAFDQADESISCLTDPNGVKCVSGRPMQPVREDNILAYAEARKIINLGTDGLIPKIGLAPRITHNFDKNLTGVSLPIFLIPKDGGLSSGLQLGWRSDTDAVSAGIFVGGTFDFLK